MELRPLRAGLREWRRALRLTRGAGGGLGASSSDEVWPFSASGSDLLSDALEGSLADWSSSSDSVRCWIWARSRALSSAGRPVVSSRLVLRCKQRTSAGIDRIARSDTGDGGRLVDERTECRVARLIVEHD